MQLYIANKKSILILCDQLFVIDQEIKVKQNYLLTHEMLTHHRIYARTTHGGNRSYINLLNIFIDYLLIDVMIH